MLSIHTLSSASQAAQYYESGDYYVKGEEAKNNSWHGKGAAELGLNGDVDAKQFKQLLQGIMPDGTQLKKGFDRHGNEIHRPGYDLTFSACKSASILAIVGGDERIFAAHIAAVKDVLNKIESEMAATRVRANGAIAPVKTDNLVIATFNHTDSRALDPNLHTHCILLNLTKYEDKWRTIYGDDLYNKYMSLGLEYRINFAQRLMKLGYEIEQTSKNGLFEIAGVPKDLIEFFSKRRAEIKQDIKDSGRESSDKVVVTVNKGSDKEKKINTTVSALATIYSRASKKHIQFDELQKHWDEQLGYAGHSKEQLTKMIDASIERGEVVKPNSIAGLKTTIPEALQIISDKRHEFTLEELSQTIRALSVQTNISTAQLNRQIKELMADGTLVPGKDGRWKSIKSIEAENNICQHVMGGQGNRGALLPIGRNFVLNAFSVEAVNKSQVNNILANQDSFQIVSYVDRHAALDVLKEVCKFTPHYSHYVISKSARAAKAMGGAVGVDNTFSTKNFINYTDVLSHSDNTKPINAFSLWIVHRAEELTNKEIESILSNASKLNARVIFSGNEHRIGRQNTNAGFKTLLNTDAVNTKLHSYDRELAPSKDIDFKNAVKDYLFVEHKSEEERFKAACKTVADDKVEVLFMPNQNLVDKANAEIRAQRLGLDAQQKSTVIQRLNPVFLPKYERKKLASYHIGDTIKFNHSIQNTAFKKESYYTIANLDVAKQQIILADDKNVEHVFNFSETSARKVSVYRQAPLDLAVGDKLRWNDGLGGASQYASFVVDAISGSNLSLKSENGIINLDLNTNASRHLAYNYAASVSQLSKHEGKTSALYIDAGSHINAKDLYWVKQCTYTEPVVFCASKDKVINDYVDSKVKTGQANDFSEISQPSANDINMCSSSVDYAIAKLSEREAAFKLDELKHMAYAHDITVSPPDIDKYINNLVEVGLLSITNKDTVVHMPTYHSELRCLEIQSKGEGALAPVVGDIQHIKIALSDKSYLTSGQAQAIEVSLTTKDRVCLIQGVAGAGKTTMLKELKVLAREQGYEMVGIANTASAKHNLQAKSSGKIYNEDDPRTFIDSGIESHTLARFLLSAERILNSSQDNKHLTKTILVLDEASLVSAKDMESLLNITEKLNMRILAIGDERQLPSIGASRAFGIMLANSKNPVTMNINTRLKNSNSLGVMQEVYGAVNDLSRIDEAFNKLQKNVVEVPDKNERLHLMANYYAEKYISGSRDVMPMLPENKDRQVFNKYVREQFKEKGVLNGASIMANVLQAKDMATVDLTANINYQAGDTVRFNKSISRLGIKAGEYYTIQKSTPELITLQDSEGNRHSWNPFRHSYSKGSIELYQKQNLELMAGDLIRWRRNFEDRGIINSETAQVIAVKDNVMSVKLKNGTLQNIDLTKTENLHFDYAYGATVHMSQGLDMKNPIGLLDGPKPYYTNIENIREGDIIVIPGNDKQKTLSKVGLVTAKCIDTKDKYIIATDRAGNDEKVSNTEIQIYPDFSKAKHHPLSTINNFLVQATRGDDFVCFVDNVEGYMASLKASFANIKKSAMETLEPDKAQKINSKLKNITSTVYGLAKPEELQAQLSMDKTVKPDIETNFVARAKSMMKEQYGDKLASLKETLNMDALGFAEQILGRAVTKNSQSAHFAMGKDRAKANLSLELSGLKQGIWCDHRTGEGGDLISLYASQYNLSYKDAVKELCQQKNINSINPSKVRDKKISKNTEKSLEIDAARKQSIARAKELYSTSQKIAGTPGEKYLRDIRGISCKLPDDFRFTNRCWHKDLRTRKPALLIPAYDSNGELQSVSRIYLSKSGEKLNEQFIDSNRMTAHATQKAVLGPSKAATVNIRIDANSHTTYISEGVENALSVRQAIGKGSIVACFGVSQIKNVSIPKGTRDIVICADNDGKDSMAFKALQSAAKSLSGNGYNVSIAMPAEHKKDFNDLLQAKGADEVRNNILSATKFLEHERY